jgi:hypothetical protein
MYVMGPVELMALVSLPLHQATQEVCSTVPVTLACPIRQAGRVNGTISDGLIDKGHDKGELIREDDQALPYRGRG